MAEKENLEKEIQELGKEKTDFWKDSAEESSTDEAGDEAFYEARRQERRERAMVRRKKKKRIRILVGTVLTVAALVGAGFVGVRYLGFEDEAEMLVAKARDFFGGKEQIQFVYDNEEEPGEEEAPVPEVSPTQTPEEAEAEAAAAAAAIKAEEDRINRLLVQAESSAVQYDYDSAISLLKNDAAYNENQGMQEAAARYQQTKDACVAWTPDKVTHVFYHSLIVDTQRAFDWDYKADGYNQVMTTIKEFNQITQTMYDRGYVMVSLRDLAEMDGNGVMTAKEIRLPEGKIPFVLSQDDACYYHCMDGDGFATKLVLDAEGKVRNEYVQADGATVVGDYDVVPLIDRFVEAHPDFSYHGAKGILALTGYNGVLGYRTDISYQTRPADLYDDKLQWLEAHPDFSLEAERAAAKAVADAMKAEGWEFASHTWGHKNMSDVSMERLIDDTKRFKESVEPVIGATDVIIFAFGADITKTGYYTGNEKFEYLKSQGYNYYCNVDSNQYWVQITEDYFRQGRRNLDGYRMYYNPEQLEDLFDAGAVLDSARPLPVPPMNGG